MKRRYFLAAISALLFLGWLAPITDPTTIPGNVDDAFTRIMNEELERDPDTLIVRQDQIEEARALIQKHKT